MVAPLRYPIAQPFFGGMETHTHLLASMLEAKGHHVTLMAAEGSDAGHVDAVCLPTIVMEGRADSARAIASAEREAYAAVVSRLRDGNFQVIHYNAFDSLPLEHCRDFAAPFIAVLHLPPFDSFATAMTEASDHVSCVSVSPTLVDSWPQLKRRPIVIDNGIDLAAFPFSAVVADEPFAVWSGRIVREKGLHLAIDAVQKAEIALKFAGPIIDVAYWRDAIAPRLGDGVEYLGHLDQQDLAKVVRNARVAVCTPCWDEPFGIVVVEALASGTPVAGFARGALPEILDATCGALAASGDVAGLAAAVGRCLGLDRRACRDRAERRFDAHLMVARYEALYRRVIAERAVGSALTPTAA